MGKEKDIMKYNVTGDKVNGEINVFWRNVERLDKKLKTSLLGSFDSFKKKSKAVMTYINPTKGIVTATLAIAIISGSLTGCKGVVNAQTNNPERNFAIIYRMTEPNLTSLVNLYKTDGKTAEMEEIVELNNLPNRDTVRAGARLNLNVTESELDAFVANVDYEGFTKEEAWAYFVKACINEYRSYGFPDDWTMQAESDLANAYDTQSLLKSTLKSNFTPEEIANLEYQIKMYFILAVTRTQANTGKCYGKEHPPVKTPDNRYIP